MFNSADSTRQPGGFLAALLFAVLVLTGLGPTWATAQEPVDPTVLPQVIDVRLTTTAERARLILDLSAPTEFAIASLDEPMRIALDVKVGGLGFAAPPDPAGDGMVESYTVEMAETGRARTMVTLSVPAQVQQAYMLEAVADQPARLVVDFILATRQEFAAHVAADLAASLANRGLAPAVASTEPGTHAEPGHRPLVVIDPGHGGIDNGASAGNGVHEKDIVLGFAVALQEVLVKTGKFDVALTRQDDTYLTLSERVDLARQNQADLFISLHADSFQQPDIRGASVYTRDERATDVLDAVLAKNENRYDVVAGFVTPDAPPQVSAILLDLMRRQMRRESFVAAQAIVHQLEPAIALRRFPVRQADFFVLQAPDVPSLLIELGFLSNANDIANLQQSDWRDRVVAALARGIADYFDAQAKAQVAARQ